MILGYFKSNSQFQLREEVWKNIITMSFGARKAKKEQNPDFTTPFGALVK